VSPDEIKQLRQDLKLSARQLASAIKAAAEDVWAWESGERFPTKRFVLRMLALRKKGGAAKAQTSLRPERADSDLPTGAMRALADPMLWQVVRKLLAHPKLLSQVTELASEFPDPVAATVSSTRKHSE